MLYSLKRYFLAALMLWQVGSYLDFPSICICVTLGAAIKCIVTPKGNVRACVVAGFFSFFPFFCYLFLFFVLGGVCRWWWWWWLLYNFVVLLIVTSACLRS